MRIRKRWEVKHAVKSMSSTELETALSEGWEPFAVVDTHGAVKIHLRRRTRRKSRT
jgi:hypothetical protein